MEGKRYRASTKTIVITENTTIRPDGFSDIIFQNTSADVALLNGSVLLAQFRPLVLQTKPYVVVDEQFTITFDAVAVAPRLEAILVYYNLIDNDK